MDMADLVAKAAITVAFSKADMVGFSKDMVAMVVVTKDFKRQTSTSFRKTLANNLECTYIYNAK